MGIIAEFKQGCSEGWNMYWSPLSRLVQMARGIVNTNRVESPVYAS